MTIQELSDEMRKERARCSTHCGAWNSKDRDCEIYGEQHCPPSKCRYFLAIELERRMKDEEKAEEWWNNWAVKDWNDIKEGKRLFIQAFLAGLKVGRPQWHEITDWKKQEQFPDNTFEKHLVYVNLKHFEIKQYMVCILDITEGYRQFYLDDGFYLDDDSIDPEDVIAWCELPTFDKE